MTEQEKNPYTLVWYRRGWSRKRTEINNAKFWEWEHKHGNLAGSKNNT